jgi:hypothetical protein
LKQKIKNKTHLWKRSIINQEWHLALEVLTSEMAHTGMERENTPAKQHQAKPEQLKLNKTNPSMWS